MSASASTRVKGSLSALWRFVRTAPLTYLWLTALLITTLMQPQQWRGLLHALQIHRSTNLRHLGADPLDVLFTSLFWIDGRSWTPYLVLFTLFLAPAEQWLGQMRWLTMGLTAHIGATYISEGALYIEIHNHLAPERMVNARDIGVSYFLFGVTAVLAYHITPPWRWVYLVVLVGVFAVALIINPGFTNIGHLAAIFIGLCFYPMVRRRHRPLWDPVQVWLRWRGSPKGRHTT